MSDFISRQDAIDEVINLWANKPFGNPALVEIKDCIEALPSAERKGTWIYHTEPLAFRPYGHYTCNLCNEISWDKSNFCPNCGAEMDNGGDAK